MLRYREVTQRLNTNDRIKCNDSLAVTRRHLAGVYIGGGPLTKLKWGENDREDMALMLSQHWGWHSQERKTRLTNIICIVTVSRTNFPPRLPRCFSLPRAARDKWFLDFFLTPPLRTPGLTGLGFCFKYIFWRSSSSLEVSFRMLERARSVGSWGDRDFSRLLVIFFSLDRCSRASGRL